MDLRHLALILDAGRRKARDWAGPSDAALVSALSAMTKMACYYARYPNGGTLIPVDDDFAALAARYE